MDRLAEGDPRNEAGPDGGEDLAERVEALSEQVAELKRQNRDLERFRGLALDVVCSLGEAARRAGQAS